MNEQEIKLRDELDQIYASLEHDDVISRIAFLEQKHFSELQPACGRFVLHYEYCYNLILKLMHKVNYIDTSNWSKHRWTQYLILYSNLNSIHSSFSRVIRGFYYDSVILIRPVYEAFIMCIFITLYPDTYEYIWLDDKTLNKIFKGKRRFHVNDFIKQDLGLNWTKYDILSQTTHINRLSMADNIKEYFMPTSDKKKLMGLSIDLDIEKFSMGANFINYILYVYLKFILTFFITEPNEVIKEEELKHANKLLDLLKESFKTHKKTFWFDVSNDTNDIFQAMLLTENGAEWKISWETIRNKKSDVTDVI